MLIAALCLVGFGTYFAGLIVIMPWLAYANWPVYRATLVASPLRRG